MKSGSPVPVRVFAAADANGCGGTWISRGGDHLDVGRLRSEAVDDVGLIAACDRARVDAVADAGELLHFARRPGAGHDYLTQAKWVGCEREIVLRGAGCQRECEGAGANSDRASAERCGPGGTLCGHEKRVAAIDLRSRADPERGNGDDGSGDGRFILAEDVAGDACWFLRVQDQGDQRKREERKRWNREARCERDAGEACYVLQNERRT